MPLYDYTCKDCGCHFEWMSLIKDRNRVRCINVKCRSKNVTLDITKAPSLSFFPEGEFEHIAKDPIYISSKRQLKEECEKHDCYAPGILD